MLINHIDDFHILLRFRMNVTNTVVADIGYIFSEKIHFLMSLFLLKQSQGSN